MKQMKFIFKKVAKEYLIIMFQCDVFNEYYAIMMHLFHAYKTEFIFTLK